MLKFQINMLPDPGLFIQSLPLSIRANVRLFPRHLKGCLKICSSGLSADSQQRLIHRFATDS